MLPELFDDDPAISVGQLAIILEVSRTTVRRAISTDLRYKSCTTKIRRLLTPKQKEARITKCQALICSVKA